MRIIGISGRMKAGKTTLAKALQSNLVEPSIILSFGKYVKQEVARGMGYTDDDWPAAYHEKPKENFREIWQAWGDGMRTIQSPDYWVSQLHQEANYNPDKTILIDDVRYENEAQWIIENGGILIHLQVDWPTQLIRGAYPEALGHDSEKGSDSLIKYATEHGIVLNATREEEDILFSVLDWYKRRENE